jgi:hypothetical protein
MPRRWSNASIWLERKLVRKPNLDPTKGGLDWTLSKIPDVGDDVLIPCGNLL